MLPGYSGFTGHRFSPACETTRTNRQDKACQIVLTELRHLRRFLFHRLGRANVCMLVVTFRTPVTQFLDKAAQCDLLSVTAPSVALPESDKLRAGSSRASWSGQVYVVRASRCAQLAYPDWYGLCWPC
jgi:hypothetical protein